MKRKSEHQLGYCSTSASLVSCCFVDRSFAFALKNDPQNHTNQHERLTQKMTKLEMRNEKWKMNPSWQELGAAELIHDPLLDHLLQFIQMAFEEMSCAFDD